MKRKPSTLLCHDINDSSLYHGAVVPPIFQNSLFTFNDWESIDNAFNNREHNFIYSRGRNPTVQLVEEKLAQLACGERAQLFPSGMAAITGYGGNYSGVLTFSQTYSTHYCDKKHVWTSQ